MTAPLPDDLSLWPENPFELLGIEGTVDQRTVRRNYTQLIRKFSPEKFPEHFQRIRAAYEFVQSCLDNPSYREARTIIAPQAERPPTRQPDFTAADDEVDTGDGESTAPTPSTPLGGDSDQPSVQARLEQFWQKALEGDWDAAYQGLAEWHRHSSDPADSALRLYWLLTLDPKLDPSRSGLNWLIDGMRGTGAAGRLFEVYRGALEDDPQAVDQSPNLLEQEISYSTLRQLCQHRWQRALDTGNWQTIAEDLDRLRNRMRVGPANLWVGLLFHAIDFLALSDNPNALHHANFLQKEITEFPELELSLESEHHRADAALLLAAERQKLLRRPADRNHLGEVGERILELVPRLWTGQEIAQRNRLLQLCAQLAEHPQSSLQELDTFSELVGFWHLQFLAEVLLRLPRPGADPVAPDASSACNRIGRFLDSLTVGQYLQSRLLLLRFCQREWLSPLDVAGFIASSPTHAQTWSSLPGSIRSDVALRLVWSACFALGVGEVSIFSELS